MTNLTMFGALFIILLVFAFGDIRARSSGRM